MEKAAACMSHLPGQGWALHLNLPAVGLWEAMHWSFVAWDPSLATQVADTSWKPPPHSAEHSVVSDSQVYRTLDMSIGTTYSYCTPGLAPTAKICKQEGY